MTAPYFLIKPPKPGRPARLVPKHKAPKIYGRVHWLLPPKSNSTHCIACKGPIRRTYPAAVASPEEDRVTCPACLEQMAGRVVGALQKA